jgi:hypothetical protein
MLRYELEIRLANGNPIQKYEKIFRITAEKMEDDAKNARNPKEYKNIRYCEEKKCIEMTLMSTVPIKAGYAISGITRSLLNSGDEMANKLMHESVGKRIFSIISREITSKSIESSDEVTDSRMLCIIIEIAMGQGNISSKDRSNVLKKLKNVLYNSQEIYDQYFKVNNNSTVEPDKSEKAQEFYDDIFYSQPEFYNMKNKELAGETMCSLATVFGKYEELYKPFEALVNSNRPNGWKRGYTQDFSDEDIKLFYEFRANYHNNANHCLLPRHLNRWRGTDGSVGEYSPNFNQGDFIDVYLNLVRNYYISMEDNSEEVNQILARHIEYFKAFGTGEQGWRNYICKNLFTPLVNMDTYTVKDLFAPPEEYKQKCCAPIVGKYHRYGRGYALPQDMSNPKEAAINYAKNSLFLWEERAKIISISGDK